MDNVEKLGQMAKPGTDDACYSASASSSPSLSTSSSANSDGEADLDDDELPIPFRACMGGKIHLQHFVSIAGVVPYCRDTPFTTFCPGECAAFGGKRAMGIRLQKLQSKNSHDDRTGDTEQLR